jgi:hypothetical protein
MRATIKPGDYVKPITLRATDKSIVILGPTLKVKSLEEPNGFCRVQYLTFKNYSDVPLTECVKVDPPNWFRRLFAR